jgi:hypothetical protein
VRWSCLVTAQQEPSGSAGNESRSHRRNTLVIMQDHQARMYGLKLSCTEVTTRMTQRGAAPAKTICALPEDNAMEIQADVSNVLMERKVVMISSPPRNPTATRRRRESSVNASSRPAHWHDKEGRYSGELG